MDDKMERENHKDLRNSICWQIIFEHCVKDTKNTFRVIWKAPGDATIESYWDIQSPLRLLGTAYYRNRFLRYISGDRKKVHVEKAQDEYLAMWGTVQMAMADCLSILDDTLIGRSIVRGFKLERSASDESLYVFSKAVSHSRFLLPTWRHITGKPDSMDAEERFLREGWTHKSTEVDSKNEDFPSPEDAFTGLRIPESVNWETATQLRKYLAALRAAPSIPDERIFRASSVLTSEQTNDGTAIRFKL
ncbi:hypothetical protein QFC20_005605 [Naganishia adeliensis]|uniref:Uncharacterized protein n=1 Tax=Naganishia adeliensis TaxID=92952 RepID=A0ACC2VKA2_9TREE|nr:hypothetical protein QFC20_005605 [Naganishia adeliensis]